MYEHELYTRRACKTCGESYAFGSFGLTRQLLLTYCCVACAVKDGMNEDEAEKQLRTRVTLDGELFDKEEKAS